MKMMLNNTPKENQRTLLMSYAVIIRIRKRKIMLTAECVCNCVVYKWQNKFLKK